MAFHKAISFTFLLLLVVEYSQPNPITKVEEKPKPEDYRLQNDVVPISYKISLTVPDDFHKDKKFTGTVEISIQLKGDQSSEKDITLNAKYIKLSEGIRLHKIGVDENLLDPEPPKVDNDLERIVFKLSATAEIKKSVIYILSIPYSGTLHEDMYGFYLSSYELQNGKTEWLATTQFQPTHARRAFPCFDEPQYKAEFDIDITSPVGYRALSNGDILSTDETTEGLKTTFETTPKMSTYLVAFIVSRFESIYQFSNEVKDNRVWSRIDLLRHGRYALNVSPKILGALDEVTKINYNKYLKKLDQIAIPDFSAGAMENWGLVTYRESALLWDEEESPRKTKQRVAGIIAHELTHMWFGNLVTCNWWSATWLNEGFATYFQYFITHKVEDQWELDKQFVIEQQQTIFDSDALSTSKPLTSEDNDVLTPAQISGKFSSISYNKGASVIRMMENFLETETFEKGIQKYLADNEYGNTEPKHLWKSFGTVTGLPTGKTLEGVMEAWTTKSGYPVVTVERVKDQPQDIKLTQKRFIIHGEDPTDTTVWNIHITYATSEDLSKPETNWLDKNEDTIKNAMLDENTWLLLNIQNGYYRVNYEKSLREQLINFLKEEKNLKKINVINRAQLVDDAMNLARAGMLEYGEALDLASYLKLETDYYPWYSGFKAFSYLRQRLNPKDDAAILLKNLIRSWMTKLYESASFDINDDITHIESHKNELALSWACEFGVEDCIQQSKELFKAFRVDKKKVHPDLRSVVYCYGIRDSENEEDWEFLRKELDQTQLPSEISTIITALGCSKDAALLEQYLDQSVDPTSGIRKQDANSVYTAVITGNPEGIPVAFKFLTKSFQKISQYYGGMNALSSVITTTADRLNTKEQIQEFEIFIEQQEENLGAAAEAGKQAIDKARENLEWVKNRESELLEYLEENAPTTEAPETKPTATSTVSDPSTTPSGATSVSLCSTILIFATFKAVFRIL